MNLADRVVLVTGSSRGIGGACAVAMARRGARVITHGRDPDRIDGSVASLGVKTLGADLQRSGAALKLAADARDVYGRVDAVVHCAGLGWYGNTAEMPEGKAEELLDVNLRAPILLCRALLPDMIDRGTGHLAFVGSIAGLTGVAHEAAYSATKAALLTFADSLRTELTGTGVKVSCVSPGAVRTQFFERRGTPYERRFPRPMEAERVAEAVVRGIERDRPSQIVPRWLAIAPAVRAAAPGLFRSLNARFG